MWAAGYGRHDAVKLLLGRGADPDLQDNRGMTALMIAVHSKSAASVAELLNHGARTDMTDRKGRTASELAVASGDQAIAALLRQATRP